MPECRNCDHYSQKFGYCGGDRPDLPNAYGINHPLKKLPQDRGARCEAYAPTLEEKARRKDG